MNTYINTLIHFIKRSEIYCSEIRRPARCHSSSGVAMKRAMGCTRWIVSRDRVKSSSTSSPLRFHVF